jgi:hypothetical protein
VTLSDAITRVAAHLEAERAVGGATSAASLEQIAAVLRMLQDAGIVKLDPPRRTVWLDVIETRDTRPKARVDLEHVVAILNHAGYDVTRRAS